MPLGRSGVEETRLEAKAKGAKKSEARDTSSEDRDPLEAKDRIARGQGQELRTQGGSVLKKGKVLKAVNHPASSDGLPLLKLNYNF